MSSGRPGLSRLGRGQVIRSVTTGRQDSACPPNFELLDPRCRTRRLLLLFTTHKPTPSHSGCIRVMAGRLARDGGSGGAYGFRSRGSVASTRFRSARSSCSSALKGAPQLTRRRAAMRRCWRNEGNRTMRRGKEGRMVRRRNIKKPGPYSYSDQPLYSSGVLIEFQILDQRSKDFVHGFKTLAEPLKMLGP